MENKATDNEIKKALEYCTSVAYLGVCKDCAYMKFKTTDNGCLDPMLKDALDLINRLEAEIERLKQNLEEAHIDIRERLAEIERMREISEAFDIEHEAIKNCAVKEFAERLENKFNCIPQHHFTLAQVLFDLDKTKKEMVGEE